MKFLSAALLLAASLFAQAAPPPAPGQTTPLFDGTTLAGWEGNKKLWRVQDGALSGGSLTEHVEHNDFLATTRDYGDFIVRFKIKLVGTGFVNSGFQIRSERVPGNSEMKGYQCDYGEPNWYGAIYDESRRDRVMSPADMAALRPVIKKDDWNDYVIRAHGPRITTWLNGVQATDYTEADPAIPLRGKLGIQVHGGGKALVQVKEITIEELPPPAPGTVFIGAPQPGKAAKPSPLTPEEQRASFTLPPGFEIELVAAESDGIGKFITVDWDQQGRMWSMTAFDYPVDGNENPAAAKALYANPGKDKVLVWDGRQPSRLAGQPGVSPVPADGQAGSPSAVTAGTAIFPPPRIFADGLAIPLGILPYKNGCYVQHGPDIVFLSETDADGKADKREVILSGFGVQDSHLFPHQFTRAPGGWIWMAQGAFNSGKVRDKDGREQQFDATRMAKFRPDGSQFEITSQGPCNIWGLVIDDVGQAWIQEANDYGFPVMPFHEYANYPGCSDSLFKSYAPEFPGTAPDFKMGGTGLSGLALSDKKGAWAEAYAGVMFVANPITRQIQAIKITPDGPRFRYEKLPDFINSADEWFRPIAIHFGPDGCLYIVDWYNKIISHNEVPRVHPDRDKTRGRIWRVKGPGQKPFPVPDFTKLTGDELIAKLGGDSLRQSHLAWQAIGDRRSHNAAGDAWSNDVEPKLQRLATAATETPARRIQALWALESLGSHPGFGELVTLSRDKDANVRREAVRAFNTEGWSALELGQEFRHLVEDPDPTVRAELVRWLGRRFHEEGDLIIGNFDLHPDNECQALNTLLAFAKAPLSEPTAPATRNGKPIKVAEAYDREFERYLVRHALEAQPKIVAWYLDNAAAKLLPVEARLLASLALEPKSSAAHVAQLLPQLTRPPGQEEVLRLAQFLDEPGVGEALKATLANPATRIATLEALLAVKTKLDPAKLTPLLTDAARQLFAKDDAAGRELAIKLASGFQLAALEPELVAIVVGKGERGLPARPGEASSLVAPSGNAREPAGKDAAGSGQDARALQTHAFAALRALREIGVGPAELFAKLTTSATDPLLRDEALVALASSKDAKAAPLLLAMWPQLAPSPRRTALDRLTASKAGAQQALAAIQSGVIAKTELDGATVDRLLAVLGDKDPALNALVQEMAALFRPVLALDGTDHALVETDLTLAGPFTVETWVRLAPGISNDDGILGAPGVLDINFFDAKARVWVGGGAHDAIIAKKPITPDLWTHVAVTREASGLFKIYLDGTLDQDQSKPAPQKFEHLRIGWTATPGGTAGALSEFRVWNRARTADEIVRHFDRSFEGQPQPEGLIFLASGAGPWGKLGSGAKLARTSDFPPILTADAAVVLDAKFTKLRALAEQPGDAARGKTAAALCQACHLFQGQGGNIGPNLSGVGAMGLDAILRNLLTPNAAMEAGYRIYRVELASGDVLDAFFVSEDKDAVVIRMPGAEDRRLARKDIRSTAYLRRSLMPEGLLDAMPPQDVSDLFAYLKTLK